MITLALNLSRLTIPEFIQACRNIITLMTGNTNFTTPVPALTDISDAVDALEITYGKGLNGDHSAKELQLIQRNAVNAQMMELKSYVETTSGDDEDVALTTGMSLRAIPGEKHNAIAQPQNVRVKVLAAPGEAQTNWAGVPHRKSYLVYKTTDLADISNRSKWTLLGTTGQTRFIATDLEAGTKYAFMVVAVGSRNIQSAPSDPAIVMAA